MVLIYFLHLLLKRNAQGFAAIDSATNRKRCLEPWEKTEQVLRVSQVSGVVVQAWDAEAGRTAVQGRCWLHRKFKANLECVRLSQSKIKQERNRPTETHWSSSRKGTGEPGEWAASKSTLGSVCQGNPLRQSIFYLKGPESLRTGSELRS